MYFEFVYKTDNAYVGERLMDWLDDNAVNYDIKLADFTATEHFEYVFDIHATNLNVCVVKRCLEEEL